jgi:hypothetical protein
MEKEKGKEKKEKGERKISEKLLAKFLIEVIIIR